MASSGDEKKTSKISSKEQEGIRALGKAMACSQIIDQCRPSSLPPAIIITSNSCGFCEELKQMLVHCRKQNQVPHTRILFCEGKYNDEEKFVAMTLEEVEQEWNGTPYRELLDMVSYVDLDLQDYEEGKVLFRIDDKTDKYFTTPFEYVPQDVGFPMMIRLTRIKESKKLVGKDWRFSSGSFLFGLDVEDPKMLKKIKRNELYFSLGLIDPDTYEEEPDQVKLTMNKLHNNRIGQIHSLMSKCSKELFDKETCQHIIAMVLEQPAENNKPYEMYVAVRKKCLAILKASPTVKQMAPFETEKFERQLVQLVQSISN